MFKLLQKRKYPTEVLHYLAEHTLIMHVQFIIGSKRKTSPLKEKLFENDFEHFFQDIIFKRLKFDYSSSGKVLIQQIKLTLKAPITTKFVCFSCLLKCLRSLYGKQCGPRSDFSNRSSLFWVQAVCFYT